MSTINTTNLKNPSSGSNNVVLNADGTSTLTPSNIIKSGTAVASTSGTSVDFTGLPSWVKRVTVMFSGVSTNGTSLPLVQIGAGSVTTSGYVSSSGSSDAAGTSTSTAGFIIRSALTANTLSGSLAVTLLGSNTWTQTLNIYRSDGAAVHGGGAVALSGILDRVRITTAGGTDTFDAGTVNILYEG
jgi:hypothetical protein